MQEGQTWGTLQKGHDSGMLIEAFVIRLPCLKRAAGHLKLLGCLTLGDALGLQLEILIKAFSAFSAIPVWVAIVIASWLGLDYGAHSDLLCHPLPVCYAWLKNEREHSVAASSRSVMEEQTLGGGGSMPLLGAVWLATRPSSSELLKAPLNNGLCWCSQG